MRYAFIEDHRRVWPITVQCDVLHVSRSGYYAWRTRPPSAQVERRAELIEQIRAVHAVKHQDAYGAPRVHEELVAQGHACNRKTVAKCMKSARIQAKTAKAFRVCTTDSNHARPVAENIVDRNFSPSKKNETWAADITYLAAVMDLFTRKIVGWSMSDRIDSRLVVDALEMAVRRELSSDSTSEACRNLIVHSDRGVQYASEHYQTRLSEHGITCSMSRRANCWDNAPMESFFATLKKELVQHERYRVGGGIAPAVLPHHRANGSVHGGSG